MTASLPVSLIYNLNRLGQAGDEITFSADEAQRAALAAHVGALAVPSFEARVQLKKLSTNRYAASFALKAQIVQACVVTLEALTAQITRDFSRELHFIPSLRRTDKDVTVGLEDDDAPEEIDSLHYDLGGPLTEEFVLAVDPYPRAPGVAFSAPAETEDKPESPFAVLKGLKSGG